VIAAQNVIDTRPLLMQVIDTSIWIEIYLGSQVGAKHLPLLSNPEDIIVPTMIQYEIYKWLARERSTDDANRAVTFTNDCNVEVLTTGVAVLAAELSGAHKLHMSDAMIYATAQINDAQLISCDVRFKGLPGVAYFEKPEKDTA
jgi:predicted nucleic acid-binding protein